MIRIKDIITEELRTAEAKILSRIEPILQEAITSLSEEENNDGLETPTLPANPNYKRTLDLLQQGGSLSFISRELGVSLPTVKRYYNWLALNGYVDFESKDLSESELKVTSLIYDQSKSLNEAASALNCSTSNITFLRNSALQKGYTPDYIIKILYPGFYKRISTPIISFPPNRHSLAKQLSIEQNFFIYLTSPEKKIVALVEITSNMRTVPGRWPYEFDVKFIINPKPGITLQSAGINFRPRIGDTHIPINNQDANHIINLLESQPDLTPSQLNALKNQYQDI